MTMTTDGAAPKKRGRAKKDKPVELRLHERFAARSLGGEWFAVSADEAVAALKEVA